ncbi:MAG: hypothetical protein ABI661_02415, partial [Gammaproteobacteria bacterium]
ATSSALIATSKYYEPLNVLGLLVPVMLINLGLVLLGGYLVMRAMRHIHHADQLLGDLKRSHPTLAPYLG